MVRFASGLPCAQRARIRVVFGWREGSWGSRWVRVLHVAPRRYLVLGVAILVILLGALLGFGPCVRAVAVREAAKRGIHVRVGRISLGWGRVWLHQVSFSIPEAPAIRGQLREVAVDIGWTRWIAGLEASGGVVGLTGSPRDVAEQIRAWRHRGASTGGTARPLPSYRAQGMSIVWRGVTRSGTTGYLWGAGYSRTGGTERFILDRLRLHSRGALLDARGLDVDLYLEAGERRCRRARLREARIAVDFPAFAESPAFLSAPAGPADATRTPVARSAVLRSFIEETTERVKQWLAPTGKMDLELLSIHLKNGNEALNIGPAELDLERNAQLVSIRLLPGQEPQEAALRLGVEWPLDQGPISLHVQGGPVSLAALGVRENDFGMRNVSSTRLALGGRATLSRDAKALRFSATGRVIDLSLEKASLAPRPLTGISLGWSGEGLALLDESRLELENAEIQLQDVRWRAQGWVERAEDHLAADLEGQIPLTTCDRLHASVPLGMAPLLSGMQLAGTFSLKSALKFDTRRLSETVVRWDMDNRCRITAVPADVSPERFKQPFAHEVKDVDGAPISVLAGPGTASWVPFVNISRYVETALLVCEDGRFWRHEGFDREAIANSIRDNLRADRFVRGASTISMQLAKNLYLKREKTVSRKLQEVVLTMLLEQELTKEEILELYLNVIEYAPGVYGIGPAAEHYFRTDPADLSLSQSFYLASILPSPRVSHFRADGRLSQGWNHYLNRLITIAHQRKRISDEELETAIHEELVFGGPPSRREMPEGSARGDPVPDSLERPTPAGP